MPAQALPSLLQTFAIYDSRERLSGDVAMLFGWRKRSEGFEWREYVRTTILVRRADRQKRLDDARLAALAKVKDAKDRGVDAGLAGVGAVRDGAAAAGQRAGQAIAGAAVAGAGLVAGGARAAAGAVAGVAAAVPKPKAPTMLRRAAADVAMYGADMPRRWRLLKPYLLPGAGAAAAIFVFGAALSPEMGGGTQGIVTGSTERAQPDTSSSPPRAAAETDAVVSGRATAATGDLVRVGNKLVRLAGIEAPQAAQPCFNSKGRRWNCADAARDALYRLVRGRRVACELKEGGGTTAAPPVAHCRTEETDLAAALVRKGHVFAAPDGTYVSDEDAARAEKLGLWQGQADRPADWRQKVWEEAKRASPDGCPIKGLVRRGNKVYAMPWSDGYSRRLRKTRGDRWFCTEDEARAAGFKDQQL